MISRHLEAIDHIWFEIRDKHWGSGSSFKKGHRARISGEIEVDASVLLQADEGSIPQGSEGAAEAEVKRALPRTRRAPALHAHAHDGALASPQAKASEVESFKRKRDAGPGEYELVVHGCVRGAIDEP
jgi:hypothetical protein